ncbi:MAG TPA: pseudouridine synthase [Chloroflexota bacterium]|nr:pseudouridine synthase [Chloroflexota bacterium]
MRERLHKVLAHAGLASRRAAERMIREHRVRVNGAVVVELGTQVDPERDRIEVDGHPLHRSETAHHYIALHKPVGVVSTAHDPEGRPTVVELVGGAQRLYPVGRLDIDSEGLVLLTDDGELTFRLTHARFGVEKEYQALVRCRAFGEAELQRLRHGLLLEDGPARAVRASIGRSTAQGTWVRIVLIEGRQRQVRRMLDAVDCVVERLRRVRIGSLVLGDLALGNFRRLHTREVAALRESVGLET